MNLRLQVHGQQPCVLFALVEDEFTWIINDQMEMLASHFPIIVLDATNRSCSHYRLSEEVLSNVLDSFTVQFILTFRSKNYHELIARKVMRIRPVVEVQFSFAMAITWLS